MAEAAFPGQHTTTTVSPSITVQTSLRFDPGYIRTIPGILKVAQVSLNLLGFICIICSPFRDHSRGAYFNMVAMIGFWVSGILLVFYIFHIIEKFYKIPWLQAEMIFCAVWTFLYLIGASLAAAFPNDAFAAAAFFGFCAMVAYGADAFLKVQAVRAGEIAQGIRVVSKQTTTVTVSSPQHY